MLDLKLDVYDPDAHFLLEDAVSEADAMASVMDPAETPEEALGAVAANLD